MKHTLITVSLLILATALTLVGCFGNPPQEQNDPIDPMGDLSGMDMDYATRMGLDSEEMATFAAEIGASEEDITFAKEKIKEIKTIIHEKMPKEDHADFKTMFLADELYTDAMIQHFNEKMAHIPELLAEIQPIINELVQHFPAEIRQKFSEKMEEHQAQRQAKHEEMKIHMEEKFQWFLEPLQLSETQLSQVEALKTEFQAHMESFHADHKEKFSGAFKQILEDGSVSLEDMQEHWNENYPKLQENFTTMLDFGKRFHDILTPEQRDNLITHFEKMKSKWGKHGKHGKHFKDHFHH